jgi:PTH1 family peptidyl-tRNA hydrolase
LRLRRRTSQAQVGLIVLGLGNPGVEYENTRHNLGFMCVDELSRRLKTHVSEREAKALVGRTRKHARDGGVVLLAKPQTYMNLSGDSAVALLKQHRLEIDDLWVVYDELDLPFGKLRIRKGGGPGGHNGMASLIERLGADTFVRFRGGVGRPEDATDPVDHLLSVFNAEEMDRLPALVDLICEAVITALDSGIDASMNRFNGRSV